MVRIDLTVMGERAVRACFIEIYIEFRECRKSIRELIFKEK